jgi:hypothetical protein
MRELHAAPLLKLKNMTGPTRSELLAGAETNIQPIPEMMEEEIFRGFGKDCKAAPFTAAALSSSAT